MTSPCYQVTKLKVTDFQQSAAMSFADSLTNEIMSATDGMRQLMEYLPLWGTADDTGFTGDAYQYSGLYPWILNDAPTTNVFDLAAKVALSNLDDAMDITSKKYQYLTGGQWVWFMSPQMISTVSALQTLVRRQVPQLMFEGGFVMDTYNGVPILPSGYVQPASTTASVTSLSASAGGTGSDSNLYRYKVAAITLFGEQVTSATASAQLSSNTTATLTWTANTSAKSYAIYRTAAGEADTAALYDLLDIVAAKSYDGTGAVSTNVTTYADVIGAKTTIAAVHPLGLYDSSGKAEEVIFLAYLEPTYGLSLAVLPPTLGDPLGGDPTNNLVRFVPISVTDDTYAFRLKSYHALQVADATIAGAVIRRARRNATG